MIQLKCEHWRDCNHPGGGCCAIGQYDKPSLPVCLSVCPKGPRLEISEVLKDLYPPAAIDPDYVPTPANATKGRCCS